MDTVGSPLLTLMLLVYIIAGVILYLYFIYRLFLYIKKQKILIEEKGMKAANWFLLPIACLYVGMFFVSLLMAIVYGILKGIAYGIGLIF